MPSDPAEADITIDFEKSHFFRVIHVDGAIGAISPGDSFIHMSVFSEREPVPKRMVFKRGPGGVLGEEVRQMRQAKPGGFRELEADLVFNLETAVKLKAWLDEKIEEMQRYTPQGP